MSDECVIMTKKTYDEILETMELAELDHDDENYLGLADRIYELNDLLKRAEPYNQKNIK